MGAETTKEKETTLGEPSADAQAAAPIAAAMQAYREDGALAFHTTRPAWPRS